MASTMNREISTMKIKTAVILIITFAMVSCIASTWRSNAVRERLSETSGLSSHEISIDETTRGMITLNGTVSSERDRNVIERVARDTRGVKEVRSNLVISPSSVVVQEGNMPSSADRGVKVSGILAEMAASPEIRDYNLSVALVDDVVTLRGEVPDESARAAAERIALNTRGVTRVRNEIVVVQPSSSDLQVSREVRDVLLRTKDIDLYNVDIYTRNGIVTFRGTQNNSYEIERLLAAARTVDGVREVRSELRVVPVGYNEPYGRGRLDSNYYYQRER
jgi:hyperosmotically inducible periplasmic protein